MGGDCRNRPAGCFISLLQPQVYGRLIVVVMLVVIVAAAVVVGVVVVIALIATVLSLCNGD